MELELQGVPKDIMSEVIQDTGENYMLNKVVKGLAVVVQFLIIDDGTFRIHSSGLDYVLLDDTKKNAQ